MTSRPIWYSYQPTPTTTTTVPSEEIPVGGSYAETPPQPGTEAPPATPGGTFIPLSNYILGGSSPVDVPTYQNQMGASYAGAQDFLRMFHNVQEGPAGLYVNAFAENWKTTNGRYPTLNELITASGFADGAKRVVTGAAYLPPVFWAVNPETGRYALWDNSTGIGPVPIEVPGPGSLLEASNVFNRWFPQYQQVGEEYTGPYAEGGIGYGAGVDPSRNIPVFSSEYLTAIFENAGAPGPTGGGGGGGGYSGPVFDRDLVIENIRNLWRNLLREDARNVEKLADQYIAQATGFARRGGSLNLETWARKQVRETDRYRLLYERKPESMSEDQYINQYSQAAGQFGLNEAWTDRQIESGMESGAGVAGFTERLAGTRKAMTASAGSWSQRFASSLGEMGLAGRMN